MNELFKKILLYVGLVVLGGAIAFAGTALYYTGLNNQLAGDLAISNQRFADASTRLSSALELNDRITDRLNRAREIVNRNAGVNQSIITRLQTVLANLSELKKILGDSTNN